MSLPPLCVQRKRQVLRLMLLRTGGSSSLHLFAASFLG